MLLLLFLIFWEQWIMILGLIIWQEIKLIMKLKLRLSVLLNNNGLKPKKAAEKKRIEAAEKEAARIKQLAIDNAKLKKKLI